MPKKLLEGIKVVDFTWIIAGPLIGKALADNGAEVIKIEGRRRAGGWRNLGPYKNNVPNLDASFYFATCNTSKRSMAIDFAKPKGMQLVKRLIARADIVLDNFAGGAMERIGLGYEVLKEINPDIIMLSTCMMGQTGPFKTFSGDGNLLTALSGFTNITSWPDRVTPWLGWYTDYIGPHYSLVALFGALEYRRRTGKGQYIDLSQFETGVHYVAPLILDWNINQHIANRMGNRYDYAAPHGGYRCRGNDRWCSIAVFTEDEWEIFCNVIGNPNWTKDSRFTTFHARKENEDELDKLVETWTINYSPEEIMTRMQSVGVAAGIIQTTKELTDSDPQLKHRHFFYEVDHPVLGKYHAERLPFLLSKSPLSELRHAPLLGEHNEYVCRDILGMSDDTVADLIIDGALE